MSRDDGEGDVCATVGGALVVEDGEVRAEGRVVEEDGEAGEAGCIVSVVGPGNSHSTLRMRVPERGDLEGGDERSQEGECVDFCEHLFSSF